MVFLDVYVVKKVKNLMHSTRKEVEKRLAPVHEVLKMPHMPREHEHLPAHCTNERSLLTLKQIPKN